MNRRERRRAAREARHQYLIGDPAVLAALDVRCPDCNSDVERWTDAAGIQHATVFHDDSCPIYRAMQRGER